ncbi:hypothetical protein SAMN05880590_101314 [Rhizobium sp. RU35A]|uniref:Uncharacterized protein n=1 Tax=Rhizobium straminoryzae TaxID=1387186 RepID=A0A549T4J3_9HYPH|nr:MULTISPECIES: hypothetical protein [Rhizobium]TRL36700.1 hypothetical protein FNA46_17385 [Rhizobium straminoryzae]SIP93695.1 hypothetical protein SAMN05880590_101314 [Rhizobium sp. RU35A]
MRIARLVLTVLAGLCLLIGLVWMGQGSGYFPYPASSFMIRQTQWIFYGGLVFLAGIGLLFASRSRP